MIANTCVLIAMILPWCCAGYAKHKLNILTVDGNREPRTMLANAKGRAARAHAAQQNGYEIFAPFAFAVLLAQFSGQVTTMTINTLSLIFVLSRIIYCWCYIQDYPMWRSLVWGIGIVCIIVLTALAA